jgi:hypothetical protein
VFCDPKGALNKAHLRERLQRSATARPKTRDRKFQRYLKTFGLITMVGVSASPAMPIDKAEARGDFSLTCSISS